MSAAERMRPARQSWEIECGEFLATLTLDFNTGDDVPVLKIEQDNESVWLDAGALTEFELAIAAAKAAANV